MASYNDILSSETFKFLIGPDKKAFTVHKGTIARYSAPLNVLMDGEMSEAKEGCAWLEDIDEDTFVRFAEFVYTGTYKPATPTASSDIIAEDMPVEDAKARANSIPSLEKSSKLWGSFCARRYWAQVSYPQKIVNSHEEDFGSVFLSHARLYVFAGRYNISELRALSLVNLHHALRYFVLRWQQADSIIQLLRYTFLNTPDIEETPDDLRSLVIHYTACMTGILTHSVEFFQFLGENAEIGRDLVYKMLDR